MYAFRASSTKVKSDNRWKEITRKASARHPTWRNDSKSVFAALVLHEMIWSIDAKIETLQRNCDGAKIKCRIGKEIILFVFESQMQVATDDFLFFIISFAEANSTIQFPNLKLKQNWAITSKAHWPLKCVLLYWTHLKWLFRWHRHRKFIIRWWVSCSRCCCMHWHATKVLWHFRICLQRNGRLSSNIIIYCSTKSQTVAPIYVCCCWSIAVLNYHLFDRRQPPHCTCWCDRTSKSEM